MTEKAKKGKGLSSFSSQFWLVVIFEFFERGSYYGMMSILSVYLTDQLHFAKESVGLIKGTIQPLLYFLPIISGALADRFGYRRTLMIAFALLGTGYFLTAQATSYALVFGALVVMGIGAGTFKPIISGTIARVTDEENSTLGFGIFYWSINLGAFLFPLILVPMLKKMDWTYVIIASAIGTASMLIPTFFFFKDPIKEEDKNKAGQTNLIQTLANAFEIIYSPIVLLYNFMRQSRAAQLTILALLVAFMSYSLNSYLTPPVAEGVYSAVGVEKNGIRMIVDVKRNMLAPESFAIKSGETGPVRLEIYKPQLLPEFFDEIKDNFKIVRRLRDLTIRDVEEFIKLSDQKIKLELTRGNTGGRDFMVTPLENNHYKIVVNPEADFKKIRPYLFSEIRKYPNLIGIEMSDLTKLYQASSSRSFFLLYVALLIAVALIIIYWSAKNDKKVAKPEEANHKGAFAVIFLLGMIFWFLPGLSMLGRIISFVIYITVTSLFIIDKRDEAKFIDHAKFLLMIFLYSGFWILYFQMFDSVLWYVQAYVDAASLNAAINTFLGWFGVQINWFFDVEHVTVINAGTIILLQLIISNIVKKTEALPTMITGIAIATVGMAMLAVSSGIWIFLIGIVLFSIGEMTAHPKFISYIGLIAPSDKKAMYMGYLFLYGVFGSSIGGILGAKLYVHFVDHLNQPRVLWLVFSMIGVVTIVALLLYNRFLAPKKVAAK
ncbi:MAG: hypothetical protein Kow0037_01990 [Calditrichia bacterium]